MAYQHELLVL